MKVSIPSLAEEMGSIPAKAQTKVIATSDRKTRLKLGFLHLNLELRSADIIQIKSPVSARSRKVPMAGVI